MTTLIVGATGATGHRLVKELLDRGMKVKVIVRSPEKLGDAIINHDNIEIIQASLLQLNDQTLIDYVSGCEAIASCLGHNMNFHGIFGHPRKLVTDATRRLCDAVKANSPQAPVKFVLMNTVGNRNRDLAEPVSFAEKLTTGLIRTLLPPQSDNEQAADYLRVKVGKNNPAIEWAVVRPDSLLNHEHVTNYDVHTSPIRSAIFNPGKTSRINVGHFMADLITNAELWNRWKWQMPVIYNRE